jgi:2-haloacid dehalogenase
VIRDVVFDIGGVLLEWDPGRVYRPLIPDPAELARFFAEVCTSEWNETLDAGRPFDDAIASLAAEHPESADLVEHWRRQDDMIAGEVEGTAALVDRLRAARRPLYLLTNMPADVFAARRRRYELLRSFDGAVVSGEEGVVKPSAAIFAVLTHRFGLDPATTLFIDDAERNVAGAAALGFRTHHFVDAATLEEELERLGVL